MWALLEFVVLAAIVLLSITEFFYPLIARKPLFGSFRKKQLPPPEQPLEEKISRAKDKVREVKDIQVEVNNNFKSAEKLKEEADDLLNNTNN